jgi:hypothetical protein
MTYMKREVECRSDPGKVRIDQYQTRDSRVRGAVSLSVDKLLYLDESKGEISLGLTAVEFHPHWSCGDQNGSVWLSQ